MRRPSFETARLKLARLRVEGDKARVLGAQRVLAVTAEALGVARTGIWFLRDRGHRLVCLHLHSRVGEPQADRPSLDLDQFPAYVAAFQDARVVAVDDVLHNPATSALAASYFTPNGITALLNAPIIRDGRAIGVVSHEHVGKPRVWTQQEIDFASSVADIVALILEQADRLELEAALQAQASHRLENEKMDALGRLARTVAHDLKNLLQVVGGAGDELLEIDHPTAHIVAQDLSRVADVGSRLADQLLSFGQGEPATNEHCGLSAVVQRNQEVLKRMAGPQTNLVVELRTEDAEVPLPSDKVEQVLFNLCKNGFESIGDRPGQVVVRLRQPELDDDVGMNHAVLEVEDNGDGIDERVLNHIFEPYFTTKATGHGLGLASVHGVVRGAGGIIRVASEPGVGTRFLVALPRLFA